RCMKRTNLVLDEDALEEARQRSGLKTYSDVVNFALREYVRRQTFASIDEFASSDVWAGDLDEMRQDAGHVSR
ncbi:MAG: type II toxin-antitoxin system VapB family antitoxin, partial [Spirochaetaceae bacterium]